MKKEKLNIFIQARVHSSRLPGKCFHSFYNQKTLERVIDITKKIKWNTKIFLVSSVKSKNLLQKISKKKNIRSYYGDENNVTKRFSDCIDKFNIKKNEYILRITADNYLVQPMILNKMIKIFFRKKKLNDIRYFYVKPLSHFAGEIFSVEFFFHIYNINKKNAPTKEHVTWKMRQSKKYAQGLPKNFMGIKHNLTITLDNLEDLILMKNFEKLNLFKKLNCLTQIKKYLKNKQSFKKIKKNVF